MSERFETVIIGGGQAGLAVGYHVAKAGRSFVVLEANDRIGDNWRNHYDSLRLYSPARFNALPGWAGDLEPWTYPTKDDMADYLEDYARRFELPVITGVCVDRSSAPIRSRSSAILSASTSACSLRRSSSATVRAI